MDPSFKKCKEKLIGKISVGPTLYISHIIKCQWSELVEREIYLTFMVKMKCDNIMGWIEMEKSDNYYGTGDIYFNLKSQILMSRPYL